MTTDLEYRTDWTQTGLLAAVASPQKPPTSRRGRGYLIGVAALVAGLAIGAILTSGTDSAADPTEASTQAAALSAPADIAAVAANVGPAVVQLEAASGLGSGVIYDSSGLILTAAHVVAGTADVDVRLADGRLFAGTVVGAHEATDVAVISIEGSGLPTAVLGYGTMARVGEIAVALGSPFGLDQTVTAGIVSATGRNVRGVPMVQTDAAINPGNSGGPLVNTAGHVIGINDVIFTQGGGNDGIGFAIAIDIAIIVADQLVAGEDVQLAFLGVTTIVNPTGEGGAIVAAIAPDSGASVAGLEIGDRITSVDGRSVADPSELFAVVASSRPGTTIEIEFSRNGVLARVPAELTGIERS